MSHTLLVRQAFPVSTVIVTIQNYVSGGEQVLPSEIAGLGSIDGVVFGTCPPGANSLGVPLFPILSGGKILLFQFTGGSPVQIPSTNALNAVFPAIVVTAG